MWKKLDEHRGRESEKAQNAVEKSSYRHKM